MSVTSPVLHIPPISHSTMPLDNNGKPFSFISITILELTSDAIIQPLSRPLGFDRQLVYPMPHLYCAIGQELDPNRLRIKLSSR